jgi:hypothetical protein
MAYGEWVIVGGGVPWNPMATLPVYAGLFAAIVIGSLIIMRLWRKVERWDEEIKARRQRR